MSLAEVMQQHPQLNSFGIGVYEPRRKTPEQCEAELADEREALAGQAAKALEIAVADQLRQAIYPVRARVRVSVRGSPTGHPAIRVAAPALVGVVRGRVHDPITRVRLR